MLSLAVTVAACVSVAAGARAEAAVHWYSSVAEASIRAVPVNQPMMIDFWADWCAPCKVMEKEVYSTADFQQATARFFPVKIDYDRNTAVARRYHVQELPTIVFADSYGNELFRYHGYLGAKSLLALVKALPGDVTEFNRLNRILAGDRDNPEALQAMGRNLRSAGLFRASSDYYSRAVQKYGARLDLDERETILSEIASNFLEVEDARQAAAYFEKCLKEFPHSFHQAEWTLDLGRAYGFGDKKQKDKARKILQDFIRDHPPGPDADQARKILSELRQTRP